MVTVPALFAKKKPVISARFLHHRHFISISSADAKSSRQSPASIGVSSGKDRFLIL